MSNNGERLVNIAIERRLDWKFQASHNIVCFFFRSKDHAISPSITGMEAPNDTLHSKKDVNPAFRELKQSQVWPNSQTILSLTKFIENSINTYITK